MKNAVVPLLVSALVLWIIGGSVWYSKTFCGHNPNSTPEFRVIDGSFSYQAANTFYFNQNSAEPKIPSDTEAALKEVAQHLKRNPYRQLTLSGMYNISEMSQTQTTNLGLARANAIKKKLINYGALRDNIKIESIKTNNSQFANNNLFGGVLFSFFEDPDSKTAVEIPGAVVPVNRIADVEPEPEPAPEVEKETPVVEEKEPEVVEAKVKEPVTMESEVIIENFQDNGTYQMRPLNLYFPSNTYKLKLVPEMEEYFNDLKIYLNEHPNMKIYLTGHSDSKGKVDWNMRVSKLRARAVKAFMEENGFPKNLIVIDYKGPNEPMADNESEEGRLKNRRVEVRVHQ